MVYIPINYKKRKKLTHIINYLLIYNIYVWEKRVMIIL